MCVHNHILPWVGDEMSNECSAENTDCSENGPLLIRNIRILLSHLTDVYLTVEFKKAIIGALLFEYIRPKVSLLLQSFYRQKKTFSVPLQLLDQLWNTFRKICATEPGELWIPRAIIDVTLRNLFYSKWSICHSQSNTSWVSYKSTFIQDNILIFIFFMLGVQRSLTSVTSRFSFALLSFPWPKRNLL